MGVIEVGYLHFIGAVSIMCQHALNFAQRVGQRVTGAIQVGKGLHTGSGNVTFLGM